MQPRRPGRDGDAAVGGQVAGAVLAIANDVARDHAFDGAARIVGNTVAVGAVDGKAVRRPAEDRRVFGGGVGGFGIDLGDGIIIHMIAQQVAQGRGIGVVMVLAAAGLVGVAGVKGETFIHIGIAVPIAAAAGAGGVGGTIPVVGIPIVEHGHAVHKDANGPAAAERFGGGHSIGARNAEEGLLIGRERGEIAGVGGIQIPGAHHVAAQAGTADVYPVGGGVNLLDAAIHGQSLGGAPICPCGHGITVRAGHVIRIDAGVLPRIGGEPGIGARVAGAAGLDEQEHEKKGGQDESLAPRLFWVLDVQFHALGITTVNLKF